MESQSAVLLGPKSSTHEIITFYWIIVFYGQAAVNCTYSFSASLPAFRETHVATVSATLAVSLTTHAPSTATCSQLLPPVTWRVLQGVFTGGAAIIIVSVTLAVRLALGSRRASLKRLSQGFGGLKCHTFAALKKMTVFFLQLKKTNSDTFRCCKHYVNYVHVVFPYMVWKRKRTCAKVFFEYTRNRMMIHDNHITVHHIEVCHGM